VCEEADSLQEEVGRRGLNGGWWGFGLGGEGRQYDWWLPAGAVLGTVGVVGVGCGGGKERHAYRPRGVK